MEVHEKHPPNSVEVTRNNPNVEDFPVTMKFLDNSLSAMPVLVAKVIGMARPPFTDPGFVTCRLRLWLRLQLAATATPQRPQTRLPPEPETSDGPPHSDELTL